jgi:hypothetical protein
VRDKKKQYLDIHTYTRGTTIGFLLILSRNLANLTMSTVELNDVVESNSGDRDLENDVKGGDSSTGVEIFKMTTATPRPLTPGSTMQISLSSDEVNYLVFRYVESQCKVGCR